MNYQFRTRSAVNALNEYAKEKARLWIEYSLIALTIMGLSLTFTLWNEKQDLVRQKQAVVYIQCTHAPYSSVE
jgi:hypothetical protein